MADQMPHHDIAGYVLGTLTPAETSAFEAHLPGCPDCAAEIAELQSLPSLLAGAAPSPPAALRDRTLAAIAAEASARGPVTGRQGPPAGPSSPPAATPPGARPAATPPPITPATPLRVTPPTGTPPAAKPPAGTPSVVTPMRPRRSRTVRWMTAVAAALLVAAAAGIGAILLGRETGGTPTTRIALTAAEGRSGQGEAVIRQVSGGHEVRLRVSGMSATQAGTFYECWLVGPTDTPQVPNRVSVGTFSVGTDGAAVVTWVTAADLERFPKLGVTLEPDNGDPGTNGPKVLAG
jgi:anti-sigma factor RsiW